MKKCTESNELDIIFYNIKTYYTIINIQVPKYNTNVQYIYKLNAISGGISTITFPSQDLISTRHAPI